VARLNTLRLDEQDQHHVYDDEDGNDGGHDLDEKYVPRDSMLMQSMMEMWSAGCV